MLAQKSVGGDDGPAAAATGTSSRDSIIVVASCEHENVQRLQELAMNENFPRAGKMLGAHSAWPDSAFLIYTISRSRTRLIRRVSIRSRRGAGPESGGVTQFCKYKHSYGTLLSTADTGITRTNVMKMYVYIYM